MQPLRAFSALPKTPLPAAAKKTAPKRRFYLSSSAAKTDAKKCQTFARTKSGHPFNPVSDTPSMSERWKNPNTTTDGIIMSTHSAICTFGALSLFETAPKKR